MNVFKTFRSSSVRPQWRCTDLYEPQLVLLRLGELLLHWLISSNNAAGSISSCVEMCTTLVDRDDSRHLLDVELFLKSSVVIISRLSHSHQVLGPIFFSVLEILAFSAKMVFLGWQSPFRTDIFNWRVLHHFHHCSVNGIFAPCVFLYHMPKTIHWLQNWLQKRRMDCSLQFQFHWFSTFPLQKKWSSSALCCLVNYIFSHSHSSSINSSSTFSKQETTAAIFFTIAKWPESHAILPLIV